MSLVTLSNVCSHIQNCSKARLAITSIPSTNLLLSLTLQLQHAGFLSSVIRGGPTPPQLLTSTSLPHATTEHDMKEAQVTQSNIASRRLWLGLKYHRDEPVLSKMSMESKPKRRAWLDWWDLEKLLRGERRGYIQGLTRPGECLFVSTRKGILESRECVDRRLGGMVLCRVR